MRKINHLNISLIYASITFFLIFLSYFFDSKIQENSIIFLLLVVTFFGLPHGALDTLVAKKNKVYSNFYGFSLFNLGYLSLASSIFFIWYLGRQRDLEGFLEPMASFSQSMSPWRATATHFMSKITSNFRSCTSQITYVEGETLFFEFLVPTMGG